MSGQPLATHPTRVQRVDGSTITPAEIERTVARLMAAAKVPGMSIAIINDAQVVYRKSFGVRNVAEQLPMTDTTVMWAMSITKGVFAYFVMQLVDEHVIELDTPIADYLAKPLPSYGKYADLANDERWRKLTPRMLLTHSAGFPNFRFLNADGKLDIKFEPGSRYAYSGEGINLLQFVIEAKTGQSVGDMMRQRVFDRFGLTRTSMTWKPEFATDIALGYVNDSTVGHNKRLSVRAAGSMDTDIHDLSLLIAGIMRGDGLSAQAKAEMVKPQIRIRSAHQFPTLDTTTTHQYDAINLSYGLGWGVLSTPHGKAYFKEGHDDGWSNYTISFEDKKIGIVMLSNSLNTEGIFKELLETLMGDRYTPWDWTGYIPYNARSGR